MSNMHIHSLLMGVVLSAALAYFSSTSAEANDSVANEHRECFGRFELKLPDEIEVATTTFSLGKRYIERAIQFPDKELAPLSSFVSSGHFEIARGIMESDYRRIMSDVRTQLNEAKDFEPVSEEQTGREDTVAFFGDQFAEFYLYNGDLFVTFHIASSSTEDGGDKSVKTKLMSTLSGLKFRAIGDVPRGAGDCLPYLFLSKAQVDTRKIGVTFRLKSHPDVTVFVLDDASRAKALLSSRQKNEFVWKYSGLGQEVKLDHDPLPFHRVELDGRKGVSSFGTITRDDGTTDYGYLATVQGDPNAAVDTSDLTLLVQRTAKYAKGNPPVSKEELKQIAKDIAASIKRRPVQ